VLSVKSVVNKFVEINILYVNNKEICNFIIYWVFALLSTGGIFPEWIS
jgi:hypothetical protein